MTYSNAQERMTIVREWRESGLSKKKFSKTRGIPYSTLTRWCSSLFSQAEHEQSAQPEVVKVGTINLSRSEPADSGVHIQVRGVTITLSSTFSSEVLTRVLEVVNKC